MTLDKTLYTTREAAEILFGDRSSASYEKARRLRATPEIAGKLIRMGPRSIYWPRSVLAPMIGLK